MLSEVILLVAFGVVYIILKTYVLHVYRSLIGMPPGPFPLPIIGNLHQLGIMAHEHLRILSKKHGDVMRILIGSEVSIVVSGTKEVLEGLVTKSVDFAGRKPTYTLNLTNTGGKGIAFADYSRRWQFFRKMGHQSMKMYGSGIKTIEELLTRESRELHKRFDEQLGVPVDLHHELGLAVMNVVCAMIFGHRYEINDPEFQNLIKSNTLFVRGFEYDSFIDVFPILRYLPNKRIKTILYGLSLRNPVIKRHLQHHKETFDPKVENKSDLAYSLLTALNEAEKEDQIIKSYLTDELLIAMLDDMVGAGSETTTTVLRWSVVYLVNSPESQEKCYQEIMNVIGKERLPVLSDRLSLPYVDAFVHETLRMSSIAPMFVPHKTTCDTTLAGYSIPKDTQVIFNGYALHRDERQWEKPWEFHPERFLNEEGKLLPPGHHKAYLPFSAGRRICLAESLAKMELFLVISQMIAKYKFVKSSDHPLPSMIGVPGLFLGPASHKVLIEKRM
ncbi:steroid 17-alpha-hydroxylase/17,20 lyase-like isoform X2 [Hydractinia symbiolongicarpus]|nr:steroid 17-alpha-hydroxylase/17,20 lyase-like isoform X2 [Hydractinia symbiolongicarpus]